MSLRVPGAGPVSRSCELGRAEGSTVLRSAGMLPWVPLHSHPERTDDPVCSTRLPAGQQHSLGFPHS